MLGFHAIVLKSRAQSLRLSAVLKVAAVVALAVEALGPGASRDEVLAVVLDNGVLVDTVEGKLWRVVASEAIIRQAAILRKVSSRPDVCAILFCGKDGRSLPSRGSDENFAKQSSHGAASFDDLSFAYTKRSMFCISSGDVSHAALLFKDGKGCNAAPRSLPGASSDLHTCAGLHFNPFLTCRHGVESILGAARGRTR
jgi:hypothetical protein